MSDNLNFKNNFRIDQNRKIGNRSNVAKLINNFKFD